MPSAPSTACRWNESRRTPPISGPAARLGWRRAGRAGCGTRAIGCARTVSPRFIASICRHRARHHCLGRRPAALRMVRTAGGGGDRGGGGAARRGSALCSGEALTDIGRQMQACRCIRAWRGCVIAASGRREMRRPAPCCRSGTFWRRATRDRDDDFRSAVGHRRWSIVPPHVQRVAREIEQMASNLRTSRSARSRNGI